MKLKKTHRILKFKQSGWMRSYIDFNTQKRTISNNEVDKNFFKLMNNSVYGKTMENLRKIIKMRVLKNSQDFIKYTSRPTCVNWKVFENNLAAIHETKIALTLNKLIYVEFTILKTSKWEMYNFHNNFMIRKFNTRLLFIDTDSLCYELHEKNPWKIMYKYKELFDLSNFLEVVKVVGKMKDEYGGKPIAKFVGLISKKYYSILDESNNEQSTNKDHNSFVEFQEFLDILFQKKVVRHAMRGIKSKNHNLCTNETNKISLSCFDDKRYILKDRINTSAYGHKDI